MTVTGFDTFCILDWSGGNDRGAGPKPDAIWSALVRHGRAEAPRYHRNRQGAETWMADLVEAELTAGRRLVVGLDFAFGLPRGAAAAICGRADPLRLWAWLAARIEDAPTANNRFDVAAAINRSLPGIGPFWGNGLKRDIPDLPRKGRARSGHGLPERRAVEARLPGAFPVWQLAGAGAVGSQMLMGLPVLERMRVQFPGRVAVWPFEPPDRSSRAAGDLAQPFRRSAAQGHHQGCPPGRRRCRCAVGAVTARARRDAGRGGARGGLDPWRGPCRAPGGAGRVGHARALSPRLRASCERATIRGTAPPPASAAGN